jgi:RNA polymerase sigma-70 factor (ECF subfamily)
MDDALLMDLICRHDDYHAFSVVVRRHEKKILNFFIRSGVQYDAEDLVQQTFLRLYRYRGRYSPSAKVTTFLFLLARQVWIDELRKRKRRERLADELSAELGQQSAPSAADEVASAGTVDLRDALAKLPEGMRLVVELGVYQDLPYADIAEILEIPEGTVKSRMFNALAQLRDMLREK